MQFDFSWLAVEASERFLWCVRDLRAELRVSVQKESKICLENLSVDLLKDLNVRHKDLRINTQLLV